MKTHRMVSAHISRSLITLWSICLGRWFLHATIFTSRKKNRCVFLSFSGLERDAVPWKKPLFWIPKKSCVQPLVAGNPHRHHERLEFRWPLGRLSRDSDSFGKRTDLDQRQCSGDLLATMFTMDLGIDHTTADGGWWKRFFGQELQSRWDHLCCSYCCLWCWWSLARFLGDLFWWSTELHSAERLHHCLWWKSTVAMLLATVVRCAFWWHLLQFCYHFLRQCGAMATCTGTLCNASEGRKIVCLTLCSQW